MVYREGIIAPGDLFAQLLYDLRSGIDKRRIAARFHGSIAQMVRRVSKDISRKTGIQQVVLSGGVWQNAFLLAQTAGLLQAEGLTVLVHRQVPANDGGLALGQAVIAAARLRADMVKYS